MHSVYIGYDPREFTAFNVARMTLRNNVPFRANVHSLVLDDLIKQKIYNRPMEMRKSIVDKPIMWDMLSDAPMSTQHANSRFLVPHLAKSGWAAFIDGDTLIRKYLADLFARLDSKYALYCVKHNFNVPGDTIKKDGQVQAKYSRKNWSSVMIFNCDHPSNKRLTLEMVNTLPGRDLHRFCWLEDDEIGELNPMYNFLVGHHRVDDIDPAIVHFTEGCPDLPGYEDVPFAAEWRAAVLDCART